MHAPCRVGQYASLLAATALLLASSARATEWGQGDHYTFRTDAEGWSVIEPGRTHRTIYVSTSEGSDSNTGLSASDPVASWDKARNLLRQGSSDWILLKRGDTFGGVRFRDELRGESALHPIVVGSYGEGPRPVLTSGIKLWSQGQQNAVFRDLEIRQPSVESGNAIDFLGDDMRNILVENCLSDGGDSRIHGSESHPDMFQITVRRTTFVNSHRTVMTNGTWGDLANRCQGLFANKVEGMLVEECVLDHNGWSEGYESDPDLQAPNMYSHNLYLSSGNRDLTVRDNVNARAASQALRDGSGQFYVGNAMIANNIGGYSADDGGNGNYTTFMDNVLVHPAGKVADNIGGRGWGWSMANVAGSEAIRNIFAHADEGQNDEGLKNLSGVWTEDYVRYNWHSRADINPTGAPFPDPDRTMMTYDAEHGTGAGTIESFMARAAQQERGNWDEAYTARALVRYFQEGFGIWPGERTVPGGITFTAAGGDQVRWDNPENWSGRALPIDGDAVGLDGHTVNYAGTLGVTALDLGSGGTLAVKQGYLDVQAPGGLGCGIAGGTILLDRSGQLETAGYAGGGLLDVQLAAGRFRNTGQFSGSFRIEVAGGEAELAGGFDGEQSSMNPSAGGEITIVGRAASVGYFGDGGAGFVNFQGGATLRFVFDAEGVSPLGDLYNAGDVRSYLQATASDELGIDLTDLSLPTGVYEFVLADVDALGGGFGLFDVALGTAAGAHLVTDQIADEIRLTVDVGGVGGLSGFSYETIEAMLGDFDGSGTVTAADVDILQAEIRAGTNDPDFDLTWDGSVDELDRDAMVRDVLGTEYGDATLDGSVDAADLSLLAGNWQSSGCGWAEGDTNGDGVLDAADLAMLAANWQWERPAGAEVPEPATLGMLVLGGVALLARRSRG